MYYGLSLLLNFLPPAIVLAYFLKCVCHSSVSRGYGGDLMSNLANYNELSGETSMVNLVYEDVV